jgi:serine/threonine protein kinase
VPKQLKIKIIDYGNAVMNNESGSSIINTRQFRAPEVILSTLRLRQNKFDGITVPTRGVSVAF